ncbi:MAG: ester cyclase [Acidobacteriota bacterium]
MIYRPRSFDWTRLWQGLLLTTCLAFSAAAESQEQPSKDTKPIAQVAARYLAAIQAQDWTTMEAMLAEEAHYQDYSAELFGTPKIDLRGPAAIVGFWRDSSRDSGTVSIGFDFDERFVAGPNLVLRGHGEVRVRAAAWGLPLEYLDTRFSLISHLRIVDGKVTHHTDHVDYGAMERQIVAQVEDHNRQHGTEASFPVSSVDEAILGHATDYLAALHRDDWQSLERWLSAESSYLNFTAEGISGSIERAEGGEQMLQLFRSARAQSETLKLHLEVKESFVAGPNVFLVGTYQVTTRGEPWGVESETVRFGIPMVVHLRLVEGKVVEHVEYMDYATGFAQLK